MDNNNQNIAFDGHCAFAISTGKTDVQGGKDSLTIGEKTYKFSNPVAKFLFKILPNRVAKAEANWNNK